MSTTAREDYLLEVRKLRRATADLRATFSCSHVNPGMVIRRAHAFAVTPAGATLLACLEASQRELDRALEALGGV